MMSSSWVVSMTFTPDLPIEEKQLDVLSDRFDELDWSVAAKHVHQHLYLSALSVDL